MRVSSLAYALICIVIGHVQSSSGNLVNINVSDTTLKSISSDDYKTKVNTFTDLFGAGHCIRFIPRKQNKISIVKDNDAVIFDVSKLGNIMDLEVRHYYGKSIKLVTIIYTVEHNKIMKRYFINQSTKWLETNEKEFNTELKTIKIGITVDITKKESVTGLRYHKGKTMVNQVYERFTTIEGYYIESLKEGKNTISLINKSEESSSFDLYTIDSKVFIRVNVSNDINGASVLFFGNENNKWEQITHENFIGNVRLINENVGLDIRIKNDVNGITYMPPTAGDKMSIEWFHVLNGFNVTIIKDNGAKIWSDEDVYCHDVAIYAQDGKTILLIYAYDINNKPLVIVYTRQQNKWGAENPPLGRIARYFQLTFPRHMRIIYNSLVHLLDLALNFFYFITKKTRYY
ncbi:hypothetical protein BdWA1_002198 [Babesia duncani]|uniref:Signal peptide-containing protein n=1 Tax=Babesia duncani TaxID=323732 RepID=A0AAD9PLC3_9APIC|nr:hypothetical protein BdWA1_002198 [Babesia duncani]